MADALKFNKIDEELQQKIINDRENHRVNPYAFKDENSMIYRHHIKFVLQSNMYYGSRNYLDEEPNMIVSDYIASMTDDYFIALHKKFFPSSKYKIEYKPYFSEDEK